MLCDWHLPMHRSKLIVFVPELDKLRNSAICALKSIFACPALDKLTQPGRLLKSGERRPLFAIPPDQKHG